MAKDMTETSELLKTTFENISEIITKQIATQNRERSDQRLRIIVMEEQIKKFKEKFLSSSAILETNSEKNRNDINKKIENDINIPQMQNQAFFEKRLREKIYTDRKSVV